MSVEDKLVSHFFLTELREELGKLLEKFCGSKLILFIERMSGSDVVEVSENEKLWAEMGGVEVELCLLEVL